MTHIRGDVTKVLEVLKKGYEEPIVQTTNGYSFNTGAIGAGANTYAITNITSGKTAYVKKVSVTCDDNTAIHTVQLRRYDPAGPYDFFVSYFYIGYEWDTGDSPVFDTTTWAVIITNNVGGTAFTVNVYWIET